jgi:hypothetical protein
MKEFIEMLVQDYQQKMHMKPNVIMMSRDQFDKVELDIIDCGGDIDKVLDMNLVLTTGFNTIGIANANIYKTGDNNG